MIHLYSHFCHLFFWMIGRVSAQRKSQPACKYHTAQLFSSFLCQGYRSKGKSLVAILKVVDKRKVASTRIKNKNLQRGGQGRLKPPAQFCQMTLYLLESKSQGRSKDLSSCFEDWQGSLFSEISRGTAAILVLFQKILLKSMILFL